MSLNDSPLYTDATPMRIGFPVYDTERGYQILSELVEERLVAGGSVIHAKAVNWVGGEIREEERKIVSAYTTAGKVPLLRNRLEMLYGKEIPPLSQYVMHSEKAVEGWIGRNVRD